MKKIFLAVLTVLFIFGCASKEVNKANSVQTQKHDADKAWRELDNQ
jgi:uncharacterized protein YcfL